MRWKRAISLLASTGLLGLLPALPAHAQGATVTIGVGHFEPTLPVGYADFFGRSVRVHQGDVIDFQTQAGEFHSIAVAPAVIPAPVFLADSDDQAARGTGLPKLVGGPGLFAAFAQPTCGTAGQPDCVFDGSGAVNAGGIAGFGPNGPTDVDWNVKVTAPQGDYAYFCYIHPGMQGVLHVVASTAPSDSGNQITTTQSDAQFQQDRSEAAAMIAADNNAAPTGPPGNRTWTVHVGDTTASGHAAAFAMMPASLPNVVSGDTVKFVWGALEIHTVGFGPDANLPAPVGWDCGKSYVSISNPNAPPAACTEFENGQPEIVGDPGTRGAGQALNHQQLTDSGLLAGGAYRVSPSAQVWSVAAAQPGHYEYHCTVHDFMRGTIDVAG